MLTKGDINMHNRMKRIISHKDISKKELSKKMSYSIAHINYVLSGKRLVTAKFFRQFCIALNINSRHLYCKMDLPSQVLKTEQALIYLSAPYSHKDPKIMDRRAKQIDIIAGYFMNNGYMIFSPISHCHRITKIAKLPTDFEFWKSYNREMLLRCDRIYVLQLEGWEESIGVKGEIKIAEETGIPIIYLKVIVKGTEIRIEY